MDKVVYFKVMNNVDIRDRIKTIYLILYRTRQPHFTAFRQAANLKIVSVCVTF